MAPLPGRDLFRLVPGVREQGLPVGLVFVRQLEDDEYELFTQARKRGNAFGPSWIYNKLLARLEAFESLCEEVLVSTKQARAVNPTDEGRLNRALAEIFSGIGELVADSFGSTQRLQSLGLASLDPQNLGSVRQQLPVIAAADTAASLTTDGLCSIHIIDDVAFTANVVLSQQASACFGVPAPQLLLADALIGAIRPAATYIAANTLAINEEELQSATLLLAKMQAEVAFGKAIIVVRDTIPSPTNADPNTLNYENVDASQAQRVMFAVAQARNLIEPAQPGRPAASPPPRTPQAEGVNAAQGNTPRAVPDNPDADGEPNAPSPEEDPVGAPVTSMPADDSQPAGQPAVDLVGLVQEVGSLTEEIERSWSAALADQLSVDNRRLAGKASSLVTTLYQIVQNSESELQNIGESVVIPSFPLQLAHIDVLNSEDQQSSRIQGALSTIYLLQKILKSMENLQQQTASRIEFPSGRTTSWWEGGAFSIVRRAVNSYFSLQHQETVEDATHNWGQAMFFAEQMASSAENGLPEAALVYAKLARDAMSAIGIQISLEQGESEDDLRKVWETHDRFLELLAGGHCLPRRITIPLSDIVERLVSRSLHEDMNNSLARFRAQSDQEEEPQ